MPRRDFRATASARLAEAADHMQAATNFVTDVPARLTVRELPPGQIELHPDRRARPSTAQDFERLARSIRMHGVLAPLLVRPLASGRFQLIAGERRLRAARSVGLATVPVVIRELDDDTARELVTLGAATRWTRPPQLITRTGEPGGGRREPIVISGADLDLAGRVPTVVSGPGASWIDDVGAAAPNEPRSQNGMRDGPERS